MPLNKYTEGTEIITNINRTAHQTINIGCVVNTPPLYGASDRPINHYRSTMSTVNFTISIMADLTGMLPIIYFLISHVIDTHFVKRLVKYELNKVNQHLMYGSHYNIFLFHTKINNKIYTLDTLTTC